MMKYRYATTKGASWTAPFPPDSGAWEMCGSAAVCTMGNEIQLYWFWRLALN
jgi:hypothetical protein